MLDAALTASMLVIAIATVLASGTRAGWSLVPPVLAGVAIAAGVVPTATASEAARSLGAPLAFVLLAVPLAVLLDHYGFFRELAGLITGGGHYRAWMWVIAALVTAGLNLDAAVVLLTPLYVRVAARRRASAFALAVQPALLSGLASSALPISNLTNLIAAARLHLGASAFVEHLGLPTVAATVVGWFAYDRSYDVLATRGRRRLAFDDAREAPACGIAVAPQLGEAGLGAAGGEPAAGDSRRVLLVGGVIVAAVVAGFLLVPLAGGQPWEVAAGADVLLVAITRRLPWRAVPWSVVVAVLGLGVLASATAHHLPLHSLVGGTSPADLARTTAVGSAGSDAVNNLPALLITLPGVSDGRSWSVWALLVGTNVGALLVPSGSLAVLLWLSTLRRLGLPVGQRDWFPVALRVALPGLVASLAALLALRVAF